MSTLQEALRNVARDVAVVAKDSTNEHFKYKYTSAEAVCTRVNAALYRCGISIVGSTAEVLQYDPVTVVRITWTLAVGDERAVFQGLGSGGDKGDKAVMKANTAALKYLLGNAFCISWGDDPEADTDTDERSGGARVIPPAKRAATPQAASPSPEALLESLSTATTLDALKSLRSEILRHRGQAAYLTMTSMYTTKEKELSNGRQA